MQGYDALQLETKWTVECLRRTEPPQRSKVEWPKPNMLQTFADAASRASRVHESVVSGNCLKEIDVGIFGALLGRREPVVEYRTVDGGHPAPFPDMTDEQLYNYEVTFNVPNRTFDKPPRAARTVTPAQARGDTSDPEKSEPEKSEPEKSEPEKSETLRREPLTMERHEPRGDERPPRERSGSFERAEKNFDAPRYTRTTEKTTTGPAAWASASAYASHHAGFEDESANEHIPEAATATHAPMPSDLPPLDLSKPVRLVTSKQPVEIITTRARHPVYKVHGYIGNDDVVTVFTLEGQLSENGPRFLENVPQRQQLFLNVYPSPDVRSAEKYLITQHDTQEQADDAAKSGRLACIPVQFDL